MTRDEANAELCRRIGEPWAWREAVGVKGGSMARLWLAAYTTRLAAWLADKHSRSMAIRHVGEMLSYLSEGMTPESIGEAIFLSACELEGIEIEGESDGGLQHD